MADAFRLFLEFCCASFPIVLFSAPVTVFYEQRYVTKQPKIDMPPLPITGMIMQCGLWLPFCILNELHEGTIPNVWGVVAGVAFLVLYKKNYKPEVYGKELYWQTIGILAMIFSLLVVMLLIAVDIMDDEAQQDLFAATVGYIACCVSCVFLAHPVIGMVRTVLTKNVNVMGSFAMNLVALLAGTVWILNGALFVPDEVKAVIITPNACAVVCNVAAFVARWKLRNEKPLPDSVFDEKIAASDSWLLKCLFGKGKEQDEMASSVVVPTGEGSTRTSGGNKVDAGIDCTATAVDLEEVAEQGGGNSSALGGTTALTTAKEDKSSSATLSTTAELYQLSAPEEELQGGGDEEAL
ncbi:unnamed protein product [Amoebophrya sp. A120]|nr:unnamed protein product [Amoebophrya sp. A120]|eukprot:GSA120T00008689001.1